MKGFAKSQLKSRIKALDPLGAGLVTLNNVQSFPLFLFFKCKDFDIHSRKVREKETLKHVGF